MTKIQRNPAMGRNFFANIRPFEGVSELQLANFGVANLVGHTYVAEGAQLLIENMRGQSVPFAMAPVSQAAAPGLIPEDEYVMGEISNLRLIAGENGVVSLYGTLTWNESTLSVLTQAMLRDGADTDLFYVGVMGMRGPTEISPKHFLLASVNYFTYAYKVAKDQEL